MPKTVEESLLGDHSDQWIDTDCPEAKRLKVGTSTDDRQKLMSIRVCMGECSIGLARRLKFPDWLTGGGAQHDVRQR